MPKTFLFALTAALAATSAAGAAPARNKPAHASPAPGVSDNDVLRFACDLIGNRTAEAARNQRKCREGASLGQGRQRGVRPQRVRP